MDDEKVERIKVIAGNVTASARALTRLTKPTDDLVRTLAKDFERQAKDLPQELQGFLKPEQLRK